MSANPNNTPEQKEAWQASKRLGDWVKGGVTPAHHYKPQPKAPSRRDKRRTLVDYFRQFRPHGQSMHEWLMGLKDKGRTISSRR